MSGFDSIPEELRRRKQWVCWRYETRDGKRTKVPVNAITGALAQSNNSKTWANFDTAVTGVRRYECAGIGFMFSNDDDFVGVDLDDCLDDFADVGDRAREIVDALGTYTEVSPSGSGLHCILRGKVPARARKKAVVDGQPVEVYDEVRFFCTTGNSLSDAPIRDAQQELESLCEELKRASVKAKTNGGNKLHEGEGRNNELTRLLGLEVARGVTGVMLKERAKQLNDFDPPLGDDEVETILGSAEGWEAGVFDLGPKCTDTGNARRLVDHAGFRIRYCALAGAWFVYDGIRWGRDETLLIEDIAGDALRLVYDEAAETADPEVREKVAKWAVACEAKTKRRDAVEVARSSRRVAIRPSDFDPNGWLLNVVNGTIDLRTGELRPHDSADMISKLAPVEYDPDARSDLWERVLDEATGGDADYLDHIRRYLGYCLTADTTAELFAVAIGPTEAGKSTILGTVRAVMGDYAADVQPDTFCTGRRAGTTRDDLLRLAGVRLALIPEADGKRNFDSATMKRFASGESWPERGVYQRDQDLHPVAKPILHTNEMPKMSAEDDAIWRRALYWPFDHHLVNPDLTIKPTLLDLEESGPAILAWLVEGCLAWQRDGAGKAGLGRSTMVERAKTKLRASMDEWSEWVEEHLVFERGAFAASADLMKSLKAWCESNNIPRAPTGKELGAMLRRHLCESSNPNNVRTWSGVRFRTSDDERDVQNDLPMSVDEEDEDPF
jgi:putative DNA primase/helicase